MNSNTRYQLYRFLEIAGVCLLVTSIITGTFWSCALAGLMLTAGVILDYYIITDFHTGMYAQEDILQDYVKEVARHKSNIAALQSQYDALQDMAGDLLDKYAAATGLSPEEKKEYAQQIYKDPVLEQE